MRKTTAKLAQIILSVTLSLSMALIPVGSAGVLAENDKEGTKQEEKVSDKKETSGEELEASLTKETGEKIAVDKAEKVYVELDSDGSVKDVTVSDTLKSDKKGEIEDKSFLDDIENVSGDEEFTRDGDKLIWKSEGKDIKYRGTTKEEVPVGIKVTYYLDDKKVTPDQIKGKSGKVKIEYKYTNKAKDEKGDYIPFLMLTGILIDDEVFSNIKVDNGKIAELDGNTVVIGYGLPELKDNLKGILKDTDKFFDEIEIPDGFTITADVKNFSTKMSITLATSTLTDENGKELNLKEIKDKMKELSDGSKKLEDGSKKLDEGSKSLKDGSKSLADGAKQIAGYIGQLKDGVSSLAEKYKEFDDGFSDALGKAKDGADKVYSGSKQVSNAGSQVYSGTQQIESAAWQVNSGSKDLASGISTAKAAFEDSKDGKGNVKPGLNSGSKALAAGSAQANAGVKELVNSLNQTPELINGKAAEIIGQVSSATGGAISSEAALNATVEGINGAVSGGTPLETVLAANGLDTGTYYALLQAYYSIQALNGVSSALSTQIASKEEDVKSLLAGMDQLESGSSDLSKGIGELYGGMTQLESGANTLAGGTGSLANGAAKLSEGAGALSGGTKSLETGAGSLASGSKDIKDNFDSASSQIRNGTGTLDSSVSQIATGANTLSDGSATLSNGASELSKGTSALYEGTKTLNKDGISKITKFLTEDLKNAVDKIKKILERGRQYQTFSGLADGKKGDVKFILKIDEIENEE